MSEPRCLPRDAAAAYCGMAVSKFDSYVRLGTFPKALPLGRPHLWDRAALDQALDRLSRLRPSPASKGNVVNLEVPRAGQNALRHR